MRSPETWNCKSSTPQHLVHSPRQYLPEPLGLPFSLIRGPSFVKPRSPGFKDYFSAVRGRDGQEDVTGPFAAGPPSAGADVGWQREWRAAATSALTPPRGDHHGPLQRSIRCRRLPLSQGRAVPSRGPCRRPSSPPPQLSTPNPRRMGVALSYRSKGAQRGAA